MHQAPMLCQAGGKAAIEEIDNITHFHGKKQTKK